MDMKSWFRERPNKLLQSQAPLSLGIDATIQQREAQFKDRQAKREREQQLKAAKAMADAQLAAANAETARIRFQARQSKREAARFGFFGRLKEAFSGAAKKIDEKYLKPATERNEALLRGPSGSSKVTLVESGASMPREVEKPEDLSRLQQLREIAEAQEIQRITNGDPTQR